MTIDQTNGYLYFVFYDRRESDKTMTDVYLAWSKDGGETIENIKISESPFKPNPKNLFWRLHQHFSSRRYNKTHLDTFTRWPASHFTPR
jgi:hypothetical protein